MNASIVLLVMFLISMPGEDVSMQADPTQEQILRAARQIMISAHYCTLITLEAEGHPQARVMDAFGNTVSANSPWFCQSI